MWYYFGVKSSYQHVCVECESKGTMCFRCLMFSLPRQCELIIILFFKVNIYNIHKDTSSADYITITYIYNY